jgi:DNA polymerase V
MVAIIDCNSFYCSCEKLFRPDLETKPVVVLSNNDGCIVSRSDEAKKFGIAMAGPFFMAKPIIEKNNVAVFSSNYNLYGDLSRRVMQTLQAVVGTDKVEVYSVDEAFIDLSHLPTTSIFEVCVNIKNTVEMFTGIKVSVGAASTKVLSKVANKLAKKNKAKTNCVLVLDDRAKEVEALKNIAIEEVWGVGRAYAEKLRKRKINTAFDLSIQKLEWAKNNLGGVVGVRLIRELQGIKSLTMNDELIEKKMIATTRMFGEAVEDIKSIKEAVSTYIARAAEKLRRQHSAAKTISVFLVKKHQNHNLSFNRGVTATSYISLPTASSLTNDFLKYAMPLVDRLFEEGNVYKKAGVMLSDIVNDTSVQANLFEPEKTNTQRLLMNTMDNINFSQRNDLLKFASSGTNRNWKMQQNFHSPKYTTRWADICEVR